MTEWTTTTIDLLRHGEPEGGRRYRGQSDDPLSELGWSQMREAVAGESGWARIISSPLLRCAEFARGLAEDLELPVQIDARWMEIGFGEWEGRTATELIESDPEQLRRFWSDPMGNPPPGGESLLTFQQRVVEAWDEMLKEYAGAHLLLVGHAGVMRMVLRQVLEVPLNNLFRFQVPYAGRVRIQVDHDGCQSFPRLHMGVLPLS
jgi:alpha-ribazole phosphatase